MARKLNLKVLEGKLISLDDKFDNISSFISEYRNIIEQADLNYHASDDIRLGESLFDGMFQRIILNFNSDLVGTEEERASFNLILENTSDAVFELEDDGKIINVNPACTAMFEFFENELEGKNIYEIIDKAYHDNFKQQKKASPSLDSGMSKIMKEDIQVLRGITKYGIVKSLEFFLCTITKESRPVTMAIIRDLTFNQSLLEELKKSKNNYDALTETISEVIIRIDEKFKIIFANSAVMQVFGYHRDDLLYKNFSVLFPQSVFDRYEDEFRKYFYVDYQDRNEMGLKRVLEILGKNKNRGVSPMEMSFGNSKDVSGRTLTCIIRDITNRKNTERKLRHLAFHDNLTSLGNRELFDSEIKLFFSDMEKNPEVKGALFFLDLDGFKQINDTFGHPAGDELLTQTAKRLVDCLRDSDGVYRFGGDEFVILIHNVRKKSEAATVAGNVLNEIKKPFTLFSSPNNSVVNIGVSIGIALIPENGRDIENVTKNADLAMYKAKSDGKNRYIFASKDLNITATERWDMEQGLKFAITNGEIQMHYQPIVNGDGKLKGMEALIRWFHPERGYIPPDKYISIAEDNGFIIIMGIWILETTCRDLKRINDTTWGKDLYMSINLSAKQFDHKDLIESIDNVIKRTGVNPAHLRFELTETSIMSAPDRISNIMLAIKKRHPDVKFVIDDFGTGYSSLSYLSNLPVDSLKIDMSFVKKLFEHNNQKIVNSILNLSQSLDLEVIAEGIEDKEQSAYFIDRECHSLQGFLFSKAISVEDLEKAYKDKG